MRIWLGSMGLSIGGKTYRLAAEQARRISGCNLTFFAAQRGGKEIMRKGGFVDGAITMTDVLGDQPALWQQTVLLNEEFYPRPSGSPGPAERKRATGNRATQYGHRCLHLVGISTSRFASICRSWLACSARTVRRRLQTGARFPITIQRILWN